MGSGSSTAKKKKEELPSNASKDLNTGAATCRSVLTNTREFSNYIGPNPHFIVECHTYYVKLGCLSV